MWTLIAGSALLGGKVRNGGKYLIVQAVLTQQGQLHSGTNTSPGRM